MVRLPIRCIIPTVKDISRQSAQYVLHSRYDTLYHTYCEEHTGRTAVKCPSTSPANAVFTLDRLEDAWGKVFLDLYPQLDL